MVIVILCMYVHVNILYRRHCWRPTNTWKFCTALVSYVCMYDSNKRGRMVGAQWKIQ